MLPVLVGADSKEIAGTDADVGVEAVVCNSPAGVVENVAEQRVQKTRTRALEAEKLGIAMPIGGTAVTLDAVTADSASLPRGL